ncbi:Sporulation related domain protein [Caballeronia calidae]|uniref:Sporulation related domain protein n=1 Tax=Caballeronia calidae TaxID=1777139 RepID=A0A158EL04_9BURK|nr:SPOR domain-containing protein [Caballeronia calidae]SAL07539.1 Sporulation related domain protein [Caballeronia calidae]
MSIDTSHLASEAQPHVSNWQRVVIAGIGGIAPVLVSLVVVDLETLLLQITVLTISAYVIKVSALFGIGGFVGWLNRKEHDVVKLFQLGIVAPALITTALNGGRVALPHDLEKEASRVAWLMISQAYAAPVLKVDANEGRRLRSFALPDETPAQQISRGLFGTVPQNVYFVIAGSYRSLDNAQNAAGDIRKHGFPAEVYEPYAGNDYYAVVIGAQMTLTDARKLRDDARQKGLPSGTYVWTFPTQK